MTTTMFQEIFVDYYPSIHATSTDQVMAFDDWFDATKDGKFKELIDRVRAIRKSGDEDGYAKAKNRLPAVCPSGTTDGLRKAAVAENRFEHNGVLCLDIDAADNFGWTPRELIEHSKAFPPAFRAEMSPSGEGVKIFVRIPADPALHVQAFLICEAFFARFNIVLDPACKDPGRLCFVSYDPNAWMDRTRTAVLQVGGKGDYPVDVSPVKAMTKPATSMVLKERNMTFPVPPETGIHTWMIRAVWWCRIQGMTRDEARDHVQAYDGHLRRRFQPRELDNTLDNVWSQPLKTRDEWETEQRIGAALGGASKSTNTKIHPDDVFFCQPNGKYLVRVGNAFHEHSSNKAIKTGLIRHYADEMTDAKEIKAAVAAALCNRELDGGVQWTGGIAGMPAGIMHDAAGLPMLITSQARVPTPVEGDFPLIADMFHQAFPESDPLDIMMGWLAGRLKAVRAHVHVPSPMLVMAGGVNSGKSLIAWTCGEVLGGRVANPYECWTGNMLWNDDIVGSELLLIDDSAASTSITSRRTFAARFKEAMYPPMIQLRKRNQSSISCRPVWATIVCCNDTPEALNVIPPLEEDMSDKVILLHINPIQLPYDCSGAEGKARIRGDIRKELPAFVDALLKNNVPLHLRDSRSGIKAWRDPALLAALDSNSSHIRLGEILETSIAEAPSMWADLPCRLRAIDIESRLKERESGVSELARNVFGWHGACGAGMTRLAKDPRFPWIELAGRSSTGAFHYTISKP